MKKRQKNGKFKIFSENFRSLLCVNKAGVPIRHHADRHTLILTEILTVRSELWKFWEMSNYFTQDTIIHRMQQGIYHLNEKYKDCTTKSKKTIIEN